MARFHTICTQKGARFLHKVARLSVVFYVVKKGGIISARREAGQTLEFFFGFGSAVNLEKYQSAKIKDQKHRVKIKKFGAGQGDGLDRIFPAKALRKARDRLPRIFTNGHE